MRRTRHKARPPLRVLSRDEWRAFAERESRRIAGLSLDAFVAAVESGAYEALGAAHGLWVIYCAAVRPPEREAP